LDKLCFKTYTWPTNPDTYREDMVREGVYRETGSGEKVLSGVGTLKRVITGSGVMIGTNAYANYTALARLLEDPEKGVLTHPVCGSRTVYFTRLQMTQNPKPNNIAYSFTFEETETEAEETE